MFRQRLKGGHKVGSVSNPGTVPSQNVNVGAAPVYQTSNTGTHSYSAFDSSAGRSWNSDFNTSNYQNQATLNDPKPFQTTPNVAQFQNGANAQSQGYDEWSWGNEDSWNDWGNNDMSSFNTNNNFNQRQHSFNSQRQTFNTEQNTLMHGSEDQYVVPTVSGQQNAVVSEQQITTSMPNIIENANAGSHSRVDYSSKGNVLSQQTSQPSILNQTAQGRDVASNCNTYTVEDDSFHKNVYLDSSSVIKPEVSISHNMMQLQQQEFHQPDNSTSLDFPNSSKNKIGNYFNSSKHEFSSNIYEYNPNDIQSNFVADDILSSNNNYEKYSNVDHSGNGNETMLDSYKNDTDKLKNDSKSNFWSGAFANESSAPVNEIHGEQDINKTPYNYIQDPHSVDKFHSGTFESNNFASLPVNNFIDNVNQDISSVTDDTQNENESSAQPISSWDDEWGDGWEIKPPDSQTMDFPTVEHIPASEVSIMNNDNFYKNESNAYNYAVDCNWEAKFSRNEQERTNDESIPEIENTQRTKNESIPEIENTQRTRKESISEVSILRAKNDSISEAADSQGIESDSISEAADIQKTNSDSISEVADPQRIKWESISEAANLQRTKHESISEAPQRTKSESVSEAAGPQRTKSESISEVANIQVLDQGLQGIFSSPSEAASVINTDSCEYFEKRFPSSHSLQDDMANSNKLSEHLLNMHVEVNATESKNIVNFRDDNINSIMDMEGAVNVNFRDDNINSIMAMERAEISDLENVNVAQTFPENSSSESPLSMEPLNKFEISSVNTNDIEDEAPYGDKFTDRNPNSINSNSISSTPPVGPAGSIPNLHARKGSPFQPPISRRSLPPQQQFNPSSNIQRSSPDTIKNIEDFDTPEGNPILSNIQPLEQNVKLCVVERPFHLSSQIDYSENKQNIKTLDFPGMIKSESVTSYNDDIPPAHLSSMQLKFNTPKVRTLETMDDTPTSSSVLDLSHYSVHEEREPPSFKRMVPGESSKGESTAASSYQIPIIVPAMPSGRVVTGNANPQPVPSVRIKQEPNEIRAPPDGPDTGTMRSESPGVIPPIRSETIGSEDHEVRLPRSDRRDDNRLSEREREKDNQRDYYSDRRKEGGYYANDSSHRMKPRERNYDSFYGERRYGRRAPYDDDEDNEIDDDERKFSEGIRERRRRAYQDEMERYSERDRNMNVEKRRTRNRDARYSHEDEDLYYEDPSSDRSRPSSRSSSFGNVESDPGHVSHSSHIDEYYDRGPKGGDRYRDKGSRDPYRDYSQYKKRDIKERDPYGRAASNPYHDQRYGSRDAYDSHSYYYYCQQNYQKYLEQHPYYREYYRQYYGRYGYMAGGGEPPVVDDKASTRSGRSSINEEIKKSSLSSHYPQDFVDQSSVSAYESSIYPEQYSFNCKSFASGDVSRVPSVADEAETQHRMSPQLYTGPHLRASFTSGGKLLLVLPNDPKEGEKATVQLRNVQKMLAVDSAFETRIKKLSVYPGPLTIKETHKDVVLRFCEEQAIQAMKCDALHDKDSVVLMWNYLSLLVKQNGNVCGADLASLLIKGRGVSASLERESNSEEKQSVDHGDGADDESKLNMQMQQMFVSDQADLIKKFTELLCLGRKKEAVDYAIRENLWGYAMMLAAKMDSITHAKVMTSFMQTIPSTDVLQTLMQHLSSKKPEVSRNYSTEKWGDWRHHLAVMVSNPTGNVMKDRASIVSLGDALASKNRFYAAHLCYLAADVEWGIYSNKDAKLVLIGSSPLQSFQSFASDDAIQCTEIFEFAKALDSNNPIFFKFQSYKLIYGYRLAEFGFPNEALRYCQIIAEAVIKQTDLFHVDFVAKVFELASQLKYYDVHYQLGEGEVSDMPDPDWLQYLDHTLQALQYKAREELMQAASAAEPTVREPEAYSAPETDYKISSRRNSDLNRAISRSSDYANQVLHEPLDQPIEHSTFVEPTTIQQDHSQSIPYYSSGTTPHLDNKEITNDRLQYHNSHPVPTAEPQPDFGSGVQASTYTSPNETYSQQVPSNVVESPEGHTSYPHEHQNQQQMPWQPQPEIPGYQQEPNVMHSYQMPQSNNQVFQSEPVHDLPQQYNSESSSNTSPVDHSTTPQMTAEEQEYYKMLSGKSQEAPKSSGDSVDGTIKHEDVMKQSNEDNMKDDDKKPSGFLGSLFGGWRKGTNQAKLPDDKNPTIVWDDQKKKWVNKDGDDSDEVAPPPPPSTMMSQPPSILRGGIKKSRYVDPVGDKGRTKTPVHSIPPPIPAMGVMPVSKIAANPEKPMDGFRQEAQPFAGYPETPLTASQPQENQNMGTDAPNAIPMMNPVEPQQQPLFFNPAQFQTPQSGPSKPAKRAGPTKRSYNPQR